ncbi:MAG: hypothetical protein ACK43M_11660 [Allorhizobium sp.]
MSKIPDPANDDIDEAAELAEGERLLQDFNLGMDSVIRSMIRSQDHVLVESAGLTERPFGNDVRLKLSDAIFLPILGGQVLRNGQRLPSPTFTKRSLERAITSKRLRATKTLGKWTVSKADLEEWLSSLEASAPKPPEANTAAVKLASQPPITQQALGAVELARRAIAESRQKHKAGNGK